MLGFTRRQLATVIAWQSSSAHWFSPTLWLPCQAHRRPNKNGVPSAIRIIKVDPWTQFNPTECGTEREGSLLVYRTESRFLAPVEYDRIRATAEQRSGWNPAISNHEILKPAGTSIKSYVVDLTQFIASFTEGPLAEEI